MENKIYDVAIIGAGPGGLTAAVYALRSGLTVAIIEKHMVGGQVALTNDISNYPGFSNISGFELSQKMQKQATDLGAVMHYGEVTDVNFNEKIKSIYTKIETILSKTVIISTGAKSKKLNVENEDKFANQGVAYCAVCDGAFFKGQNVALVGGGNSGVEDAIYLSKIANHLTYVHKYEHLKAEDILVKEFNNVANQNKNVTIVNNSTVSKVIGDDKIDSIEIKNYLTNQTQTVKTDALFVAIGRLPDTEFLKDKIKLDDYGYIPTDEHMNTSVEGVFACGDVRVKTLRQIVTATADGAIAATSANNYINQQSY